MFASILLLTIPLLINFAVYGYIFYMSFMGGGIIPMVFCIFTFIITLTGVIFFFKTRKKFFIILPWLATIILIYLFRRDIAEIVDKLMEYIGGFYDVERKILR